MLCKICNTETKYSWCQDCFILYKRMKKYGYEYRFLPKEIDEYKPTSKDMRFIIIKKNI